MAPTMINPASSWFKIAELPVVVWLRWQTANSKELLIADEIFDKTSECIAKFVHKTWLCRYPRCRHLIYDNRSKFKVHFEYLCELYGIKHKPTTFKNPRANDILEHVHQVLGQMLRTAELDMADSVTPGDVDVFLDNAAWAICSCCKLPINVPYKRTFGAPDQGQTLAVWESQTAESALKDDWPRNVPCHTLEDFLWSYSWTHVHRINTMTSLILDHIAKAFLYLLVSTERKI